jgi:hypothetical protein
MTDYLILLHQLPMSFYDTLLTMSEWRGIFRGGQNSSDRNVNTLPSEVE